MVRNVLDMNAHFGGFNAALLEAGKSVWVMNVVPTNGLNHLPMILDRGLVGVMHDWYVNLFLCYVSCPKLENSSIALDSDSGLEKLSGSLLVC